MKLNKTIGLAVINFLLALNINSQEIDSLLSTAYSNTATNSLKKSIILHQKMLASYSVSELTAEQINSLKLIGSGFHQLNEFDSAIYYYTWGAEEAISLEDKQIYSSLVYNLGLVYLNTGQYQLAIENAMAAMETDRELNQLDNLAASLNSIALIYQEWGIYDKSLEYRLESIRVSEENNNQQEIANGYYNLGNLYVKTGKRTKALDYFELAQELYTNLLENQPDNISLKKRLSECKYSIGSQYLVNTNYSQARTLFLEAIEIKNTISDKVGVANCYYQLGLASLLQSNFEEARQHLFMSLQFKTMVNDRKGIALTYFRIADVYFKQQKFLESQTFVEKSIAYAIQINDKEILREDFRILYQINALQKNYKEAFRYHQVFKSYNDSLTNENTAKAVEELSVRFETEKKEKENVILLRENEINSLTIDKQKTVGLYLVGIIVLVVLVVLILLRLYRSKQKTNKIITHKNNLLGEQNLQIANQKKEIEIKNINLTDSIVYAKKIQDSMLTDITELNKSLGDAFIYYKPKDIVSGDFYWFGEVNGKFILSAIDCTGHGVPGAFMSMLGNTFLNQIVLNQGMTSPDVILQKLSEEVQIALKQAETNNQDGMDMALCSIDLNSKNIEFAGAKNPLLVVRKGEIEKIKGDKLPIGRSYNTSTIFQKHLISYDGPASFYMFSDGYADQFGGEFGKKFMLKRLQTLLVEINDKPMSVQKEILNDTIVEWMHNEDQIDDILVLGFRLE